MIAQDAPKRHKRGEISLCGKLRFWQYQAPNQKTGVQAERWVPAERYETLKEKANMATQLSAARRDWEKMQSVRRSA